jgi:hypothetical protein
MPKIRLADVLSEHADSLREGADQGEALLAAHPEGQGALAGLFALAGGVRAALAPVEPAPDFVAGLKEQLVANAERARAFTRRERTEQRRAVVVAAGAGGLVYVLGLAALALRAGLALAGVVAALVGRRRRSGAAQSSAGDA